MACISYQLLAALNHLHFHGIVHGDVSLENMLVSRTRGTGLPRVMLTGFYEAEPMYWSWTRVRQLYSNEDPAYLAYPGRKRDIRSDIWQAGVVLLCLATGHHIVAYGKDPNEKLETTQSLLSQIMVSREDPRTIDTRRIDTITCYGQQFVDLLQRMLWYDPDGTIYYEKTSEREITDTLLEHRYFTDTVFAGTNIHPVASLFKSIKHNTTPDIFDVPHNSFQDRLDTAILRRRPISPPSQASKERRVVEIITAGQKLDDFEELFQALLYAGMCPDVTTGGTAEAFYGIAALAGGKPNSHVNNHLATLEALEYDVFRPSAYHFAIFRQNPEEKTYNESDIYAALILLALTSVYETDPEACGNAAWEYATNKTSTAVVDIVQGIKPPITADTIRKVKRAIPSLGNQGLAIAFVKLTEAVKWPQTSSTFATPSPTTDTQPTPPQVQPPPPAQPPTVSPLSKLAPPIVAGQQLKMIPTPATPLMNQPPLLSPSLISPSPASKPPAAATMTSVRPLIQPLGEVRFGSLPFAIPQRILGNDVPSADWFKMATGLTEDAFRKENDRIIRSSRFIDASTERDVHLAIRTGTVSSFEAGRLQIISIEDMKAQCMYFMLVCGVNNSFHSVETWTAQAISTALHRV